MTNLRKYLHTISAAGSQWIQNSWLKEDTELKECIKVRECFFLSSAMSINKQTKLYSKVSFLNKHRVIDI